MLRKNKLKVDFIFHLSKNHKIYVRAKAKNINAFDAVDLRIKLMDQSGNLYPHVPDSDTMEAIEAQAIEELYCKKHELRFIV